MLLRYVLVSLAFGAPHPANLWGSGLRAGIFVTVLRVKDWNVEF